MTTDAVSAGSKSGGVGQLLSDYIALTKPRVISLLLVTTFLAMIMAQQGWPSTWKVALTMVGGYLAAGGANAINQWFDRDIDAEMKRTSTRPIPAGRMSATHALVFALAISVAAALILGFGVNWTASALAMVGLVLYVALYTMWLKRTTVQNIVIGGAAGALPPMVGWAAVTGEVGLVSIILFSIVFYWTPPHFWALALMIKNDYAKVGVPMLPVVRGDAETAKQVLWWTILMVGVTLLPVVTGTSGLVYFISALVLGGVFIWMAVDIVRKGDRRSAKIAFHYSMIYLALIFVALAVDAALK